MDEIIDINKTAHLLGVSLGTIRNWIKNKTLKQISKGCFSLKQVLVLKEELEKNQNTRLKSRRNKTKIQGSLLSKKYLLEDKNYDLVNRIFSTINNDLTEQEIKVILCEYCLKLVFLNQNNLNESSDMIMLKNLELFDKANVAYQAAISLIEDVKEPEQLVEKNINMLKNSLFKTNNDFIGLLYMTLKSLRNRKENGVYYTPTKIVQIMINKIVKQGIENKTIVDICCGSGNFLLSALKNGFDYNNIFGIDIDLVSVKIARFNIALNSPLAPFANIINNIKCTDSLKYNEQKFDYCVGNPPWGSILDFKNDFISNNFVCASSKKVDAFDLFLEKGFNLLKQKGIMYYVVPESLLSVSFHQPIRAFLQNKAKLLDLIYWNNVFDGVQAPAISIMFKKDVSSSFELGANVLNKNEKYTIIKSRNWNSKNWEANIKDEEFDILNKMQSNDFLFLKNNADFALGIVTGNNQKFISTIPSKTSKTIVKGIDIIKYGIKEKLNYIEYNPSDFQQVANSDFYFAKEKLIYRFICDKLVFAYDNKQILTLNSANVVIPRIEEMDIKYILAILNSKFAHFYFKKKFNSIKVLRSHIESIPIPKANIETQKAIVEIVNQIIEEKNEDKKNVLYDFLDNTILDLYSLNKNEKEIVKDYFEKTK
ncbi:TaqI-like C-terminal specificity domain-containing protein [Mycoplasmopsis hyopharyngis]|uniref:TaqI-like C-terminal specificity domain-containing protein n=1 Tax=Mycoplasmopsis hyopharyngis TaxID=29558 RepID=UPI0038738ED0